MRASSSRRDHTAVSARRKFTGPPNRHKGPQYAQFIARLNWERAAEREFPDLVGTQGHKGYQYKVTVQVPHYELRKIRVLFSGGSDVPSVFVDGPQDSPHRFGDGSLCMWYPKDPIERRWVFEDGLLDLLGLTLAHLFREGWWRETGEWPGEEKAHGANGKEKLGP